MSFLSVNFWLIVAAGLVVFHLCRGQARRHVLLVLSLIFYATWSPWHLLLLVLLSVVVAAMACRVAASRATRAAFRMTIAGVAILVAVLTAFKIVQALAPARADWMGLSTDNTAIQLIAPLGLS